MEGFFLELLPHHAVQRPRCLDIQHALAVGRVGDDGQALEILRIIADVDTCIMQTFSQHAVRQQAAPTKLTHDPFAAAYTSNSFVTPAVTYLISAIIINSHAI